MLLLLSKNKTTYLVFASFLLFGSTIQHANSQEKNKITWVTEAFTPFYITQGKDNGRGTVDKLLTMLEEEMSDYQHQRHLMPMLRIIEELKANDQIACASFLYDPNTIEYAQYSIPLFAVPPQELIIKRSDWQDIGSPKSISLEKALSAGQFSLGLGQGRNYGARLTKIIDQYKQDKSKIYFRVGDHFNGLADMIMHNRINATIAYSGELNFYLSQHEKPNALVHVPIKENNKALLVYVVMPKSEWGNTFLQHVNEAIYRVRIRPDYIEAIETLFDHTDAFDHAINNLIDHSKMHFSIEQNQN